MSDNAAIPDRADIERLETLSPFELRETLISLGTHSQQRVAHALLNAGRGNPNFLAAAPREAFFQLGLFAVQDGREVGQWQTDLIAQPKQQDISKRLDAWLAARVDEPGIALLTAICSWADDQGWDGDEFVFELVDGILGEHYPDPPAMLSYCSQVTARYLATLMGEGFPGDRIDLFATEGGTAAMCYVFGSLFANGILHPGDGVAVMAPVFTPYLDIVSLPEYGLEQVLLEADVTFPDGTHSWQYSAEQIDKLRDPSIKLLICINPTNPPSVRLADDTLAQIAEIVATVNPGLVIITDDVYATFVQGFRSLASSLSRNTILIYSFSKYFGATGWRLGAIATAKDTILDEKLAALPAAEKQRLARRYSSLTDDTASLSFAERLVADSRDVALRHTAGLSQPQQVQLALFALFDMLDEARAYRESVQQLIRRRLDALLTGLQFNLHPDPLRAGYYVELDFMTYVNEHFPADFAAFLKKSYEPTDILFRLAAQTGVVALNGSGFDGPPWSVRLSLANLDETDYSVIGKAIRSVAEEYVTEWQAGRAQP